MDIIFKTMKLISLALLTTLVITSCGLVNTEPQVEIKVVDSNEAIIADANVKLYFANNSDYDFSIDNRSGFVLSEDEWEENFTLEAEALTNENGKVIFLDLSEGNKYCRITKGVQNNSLGVQELGVASKNKSIIITIEIE